MKGDNRPYRIKRCDNVSKSNIFAKYLYTLVENESAFSLTRNIYFSDIFHYNNFCLTSIYDILSDFHARKFGNFTLRFYPSEELSITICESRVLGTIECNHRSSWRSKQRVAFLLRQLIRVNQQPGSLYTCVFLSYVATRLLLITKINDNEKSLPSISQRIKSIG